jgi:hypothetical protein
MDIKRRDWAFVIALALFVSVLLASVKGDLPPTWLGVDDAGNQVQWWVCPCNLCWSNSVTGEKVNFYYVKTAVGSSSPCTNSGSGGAGAPRWSTGTFTAGALSTDIDPTSICRVVIAGLGESNQVSTTSVLGKSNIVDYSRSMGEGSLEVGNVALGASVSNSTSSLEVGKAWSNSVQRLESNYSTSGIPGMLSSTFDAPSISFSGGVSHDAARSRFFGASDNTAASGESCVF